tara:strand:+ start:228 stop:620 length:393 start_codon:yes stop_codon:yes gene_type:complete
MGNYIKITKPAWNKIGKILDKTNKCSFLFSASGGGCNGYNYNFEVIDKNKFNNILQETKKIKPIIIENNNYRVLIDPISEYLLSGTTIDFEENIYESKFKFFPNKNVSHSCGCGTSFSPRKTKIPESFNW